MGERTGNFFESQLCIISEEEVTWHDDKINWWNPCKSYSSWNHESLVHVRLVILQLKSCYRQKRIACFWTSTNPVYKCDSRLIIGDFIKVLLTSLANPLYLDEMQAEFVWKKVCCWKHVKAMETCW